MVCWKMDLHPCLMMFLLFLVVDCLAGWADVYVVLEAKVVEVDVMFGAEREQGQPQPMLV